MIQDAEQKIRNKTDEELDLFISELIDIRCERGFLDEMEKELLRMADCEKFMREE